MLDSIIDGWRGGLLAEALLVMGVSLLLGAGLEKLFFRLVEKALRGKGGRISSAYNLVRQSLRGVITTSTILAGLDLYLSRTHLPPDYKHIADLAVTGILAFQISVSLSNLASETIKLYTGKGGRRRGSISIYIYLVKISVASIAVLAVLEAAGISITPLVTTLGIAGLAVALALQDTLSNLFAGIHIVATGQIRVGDYIQLENGVEGIVVDVGWRSTSVKTLLGSTIIVPNSRLAQSIIVNHHYPDRTVTVTVDVGVSYDSDLEAVERVVKEVAAEVLRTVPGGVPSSEPYVRYTGFGDYSINLRVFMKVQGYPYKYVIVHEFVKRLHARFKEEGIEIPYPITTIHVAGEAGKPVLVPVNTGEPEKGRAPT